MTYQLPITLLTASATMLSAFCPCNKQLSCHLGSYLGLVGAAVFLTLLENGLLNGGRR